MITCSNCGAGIPDEEEFCGQCGAPRPDSEDVASAKTVIDVVAEDAPPENVIAEPEPARPSETRTTPEPMPVQQAYQEYTIEEPRNKSSNTCMWIVLSCLVIIMLMLCILCLAVGALFTLVPDTFQQIFGSIGSLMYL